jgi:hypothetical protein
MTSVRNRLPLLSGNKRSWFLAIVLLAAACSPKVRPVQPTVKAKAEPVVVAEAPKLVKAAESKISTISLLLPFDLDGLNPGTGYNGASLAQANLSLDYYQGFMLALDSLTAQGYNYKLQVYYSKGSAVQAHGMAHNPQIQSSDLIVGPVFPDDMKAFTGALPVMSKTIVSPLSPASPSTYNNPNLVTIVPPLAYHARAAAKYIQAHLNPQKIFILKSGYNEDNEYIVPFKSTIDSLSKGHIQLIPLTVVRGRLNALLPQLSTTTPNIFVVPSTNQQFLTVTLRSLDSLSKKYPVILFGHPSWEKFSFLHADLLERLRTVITSTDKVNYKSAAVINFLHSYRNAYHVEPSDYSIKGFDEGLYFGQLLGTGEIKNLNGHDFTGLHNNFHFIKSPKTGWINTHINILAYRNFELKQVE